LAALSYIYGTRNGDKPMLSRLPGIELVRINDCSHFMMIDRPVDT
jgi:pimeloyl-ACP methyl ester carboxylesterase